MTSDTPAADDARTDAEPEPIDDPADLRDREDVAFAAERREHEDAERLAAAAGDRVAVGATRDDGALLTLVERDLGAALLPSETVGPDDDWLATGREAVAGYTGFDVRIDAVAGVRRVEHAVAGEDEPRTTTQRVVLAATPVGGDVDDCKRSSEAGSDGWVVEWTDGEVEGASPPDEAVLRDVQLFR